MRQILAIIDCNNFFVSCERLFRPDLKGRPVVVLSSNDGCVVARSNEAKSLGIPMGAPVFKYRQLFKQQGVTQFSANFELYGDISERITRLLTAVTPRIEVYSVDESFLDLSELNIADHQKWGEWLHRQLLRKVGVPASVGVASNKTLAKLAVSYAKKAAGLHGSLDLYKLSATQRAQYLEQTPIDKVWGVGWRLAPRLRAEGIYTALDLASTRPGYAGQLMGIHGQQMVAELTGTACHSLELMGKVRQSVMHGRIFGADTSNFAVIESAIASLTARAAHRLRCDSLVARGAMVALNTNRHKPGYLRQQRYLRFTAPTADTGLLSAHLVAAAASLFQPRQSYHRANILLYDLISTENVQLDLFGHINPKQQDYSSARMHALDQLNNRYGKHTVHYAAEDLSHRWEPKHNARSPRYTTRWAELPVATITSERKLDMMGK